MLRKILNTFRNKKDVKEPATSPERRSEAAEPSKDLITVYDAYGRELKITAGEWREKVLGPNLKASWNDADKLYNLIISALNDGFAEDVREAAARLVEIDSFIERSHTIQGIVLMKCGQLDKAETILRTAIDKAGETGTLLTNLAKVFAERGDDNTAYDILWRGLQLDPNQENGLLWWLSLEKEQKGDEGYQQALHKAAAIPNSWRPQLWLARRYLEQKDVASARALYEKVLQEGLYGSEALMMISGDLGNNGQVTLIPELVGPAFDTRKHDPRAGFNLLQAYLELGLLDDGEALLKRLYALDLAPYKQHLDEVAGVFQQRRAEQSAPRAIDDTSQLEIESANLERPVWSYGLRNPTWLFAEKPDESPRVTFISLAKCFSEADQAEEQREDDLGRYTRAIPLYLAEAVHYWTDFASNTLIPTVKGGGPAVFGAGGNDAELCEQLSGNSDYLVTGEIDNSREQWQVTLRLWECAGKQCLLETTAQATEEHIGAEVLKLEQQLLAKLGHHRAKPFDDFYSRPSAEMMTPYLSGLGQSLILSLVANDVSTKAALWGERNMLEWSLRIALQWPKAVTPKIMFLSGLGKAAKYQSDILPEFKERTLTLFKDAGGTDTPIARLKPLVWKIFDMHEELIGFQQSLSPDGQDSYSRWVRELSDETLH